MHPRTLGTGFTEREFLSLPPSHDRIELVDGEVILSPSPSYVHQVLVLELAVILRAWAMQHAPAAVGLSPLDVRFAPGRVLQPNLFVVAGGLSHALDGPVDGPPDLVIEVLSRHRSYDRMTKRLIYAEAGVPEYWIVDPRDRAIEQVCGLETRARISDGHLVSVALPGLELAVGGVFPREA